jgi:hypothetical protein
MDVYAQFQDHTRLYLLAGSFDEKIRQAKGPSSFLSSQ